MHLTPSEETMQVAAVVRDAGAKGGDWSADRWFEFLAAFGAFDILATASPDSGQANVHVSTILCEAAHGGCRAPVAETTWARANGQVPADGWIGWPTAHRGRDGSVFVPYAGAATAIAWTAPGGRVSVVTRGEVDLAVAHVVGEVHHGWATVGTEEPPEAFDAAARGFAWRSAAALTLGYSTRALDMAVRHATDRKQFGRPLRSFQAVEFRLAESRWRLAGLELLVREAAWRADRQDPRVDALSALAWLYARRVGHLVGRHAHQVFGAIGFSDELGLTSLTGANALLRMSVPTRPAARTVWCARERRADPPSTVLGGFVR